MGWADVLTIADLAALMPPEVGRDAGALRESWQANWAELGGDDEAHRHIDASIDALRQTTLASLTALD
jgi:hypothetical protein